MVIPNRTKRSRSNADRAKKKLVAIRRAVVEPTAGDHWRPDAETVTAPIGPEFSQWADYRRHGRYPDPGGWRQQRARTIAHFAAFTEAHDIYSTVKNRPDTWSSELNAGQLRLMTWIDAAGTP
jgi:hypothetical protein